MRDLGLPGRAGGLGAWPTPAWRSAASSASNSTTATSSHRHRRLKARTVLERSQESRQSPLVVSGERPHNDQDTPDPAAPCTQRKSPTALNFGGTRATASTR